MEMHQAIPETEGLYWYCRPDRAPEPVQVFRGVNGLAIRAFSGRVQTRIHPGELLAGPVEPPA
jgi:hypothetical protein